MNKLHEEVKHDLEMIILIAIGFIITLPLIFPYYILCIGDYYRQKKWWNNGICRYNGELWQAYGIPTIFGEGAYKAGKGNNSEEYLWLEYPSIARKWNQNNGKKISK